MSAPKFVKLDLATLAELSGPDLAKAATAEFSALDAMFSKRLPYLGALRFFAKIRETSLADLIATHGSATRKAFEDAKPFADILAFFGAKTIPSAPFDAIPRAQAREFAAMIPALNKDTSTLEKIQAYVKGPCKFREGWLAHVMSLAPVAAAPEPAPETPAPESSTPEPAPEIPAPESSAPAPESSAPEPAPAPELDLTAYFDELRALTARLPARLLDMARSNLARAVNSPEAWNTFTKRAPAPASNITPFPAAPATEQRAAA